jgi:hypothetical protein
MGHPPAVRKLTRVALVQELCVPPAGQPLTFVQLVTSIPGREGTMQRTWALPDGRLAAPVADDVFATMWQQFLTACELLGGAQGRLDVPL